MCLVLFHVTLTALTLLTRNHHTTQAILFCFLLLSVRCSQTINQYAAENWKRFSRQQYFDSQGMFISVVFSMPVLFNCMMMVVSKCVCFCYLMYNPGHLDCTMMMVMVDECVFCNVWYPWECKHRLQTLCRMRWGIKQGVEAIHIAASNTHGRLFV